MTSVQDKIPPPKPNLPQVVSHPDYIAFQRKLNAIALPGAPITLSNEFHANSPSPPLDFEFIDHLRYGRGIEPYDINFATFCGCSSGRCSSNATCSCVRDSEDQAVEMRYNEQGLLKDSGNDRAIYECNDNCGCEPGCLNHVVGRGRRVPIDVFMTKDKGWGKLALLFIILPLLPRGLIANSMFLQVSVLPMLSRPALLSESTPARL